MFFCLSSTCYYYLLASAHQTVWVVASEGSTFLKLILKLNCKRQTSARGEILFFYVHIVWSEVLKWLLYAAEPCMWTWKRENTRETEHLLWTCQYSIHNITFYSKGIWWGYYLCSLYYYFWRRETVPIKTCGLSKKNYEKYILKMINFMKTYWKSYAGKLKISCSIRGYLSRTIKNLSRSISTFFSRGICASIPYGLPYTRRSKSWPLEKWWVVSQRNPKKRWRCYSAA